MSEQIAPSAELKKEVKELIIDSLKLDGVTPDDIGDDTLLFAEDNDLQIDSVDALEITVALQKKYGVHIDDQNLGRFIIKSVDTISEFLVKEGKGK